ncbi:DUF4403 family protein [Sphingomonas sp. NPDC079357]|uniref:DUF4403 family protein n=1 Tax=Sphingomonas sp. NPDC079357 TaxID=3364518 RepID=UPI003850A8A6
MRRVLLIFVLLVAGCARHAPSPAPPRVESTIAPFPDQTSTIVVPVTARLEQLERGLDKETPRVLWTINEHRDTCVKGKRVNLGIGKVKVTPDLGCRLVGQVTRGAIRVAGAGERLDITMPVSAVIHVRDIGGVLGETVTARALVHATGKLSIVGNWQPRAKLDLAYNWREPPGIEIAGQRITFTSRADEKLKRVVARLERDLPREVAKLDLRGQLDGAWRHGFTVLELSKRNPPAWMRVVPRELGVGGYRIAGRQLQLTLAAEALTQTFVGKRPADPTPTPLPPQSRVAGPPGLRFFIPVLADYAQLEPVVLRTLRKLAGKGISLTGVGPVDVDFGKVTVYATSNNRLAVGVAARVVPRDRRFPATSGEAWLTAQPYNDENSQLVRARDVQLAADTDSDAVDLIVSLVDAAPVQQAVALALQHDFAPDYQRVLAKAQAAIGARQEGDFFLSTDVTSVSTGRLQVTGAGLFLPVRAQGAARIAYKPT